MADVPLYVVSDYSSSERRITPSWSIAQLKKKLEPITGIPPSCQRISLKTTANETIPLEVADEEAVYLQSYPLTPYAELRVSETGHRPYLYLGTPARYIWQHGCRGNDTCYYVFVYCGSPCR